MREHGISRRKFVGEMAFAGAGLTVLPGEVLGRGFRAPSDTLNIAGIGVAGKGRSDLAGVSSENIYALCDVNADLLAEAAQRYPRAKLYRDYREMLEMEGDNIDAVTVSVPDHSHAPAAMMAMNMGKHVFCQKPLARTVGEVRALRDAARRTGVATQMGNQGHASEGIRQIREWVEAGAIGTVREVQFWTNRPIWPQAIERPTEAHNVPPELDWNLWVGPSPERPYHPAYAPFRWRGWWDYGTGALGDMGCHIMDAAYWTLDLGYPSRVTPESTLLYEETAPAASRVQLDFPARGTRPPVMLVWRDGNIMPPPPRDWPADEEWPSDRTGGQLWVGDEGTLVAGTYGENPRLSDPARHAALMADPPPVKYPRSEGVFAEWIAAAKGGPPAGSNFDGYAGPFTEMVLLSNLAVRMGKTLELDPATGRITNVQVPDEFFLPTYRTGWSL